MAINKSPPCPIEIALAKEQLAEWCYQHQDTIIDALKRCIDEMPVSYVSKFERTLDAMPRPQQYPKSGAQ